MCDIWEKHGCEWEKTSSENIWIYGKNGVCKMWEKNACEWENKGEEKGEGNLVRPDRVAVEIPDRLDRERFAANLDLVRLHALLDGGANVTESHVDTGRTDTNICRLLDRLHQRVELLVKVARPRASKQE